MAFGVTPNGFVIKRLTDIKDEIEASLRNVLGPGINLLPTELLGQMVGILSEREALLWELAQAVYNSQYPDSANGVSLDNVGSITAIERLRATKSTASGIASGVQGTVIKIGSVVSVQGNSSARFKMDNNFTIGPGTDEIQKVSFSAVPDAGNWAIVYNGEETAQLAFNNNAAAVQAALNNLPSLSGVTVIGNYAAGFTVTFSGADGQKPHPSLTIGVNTLKNLGNNVTVTVTETTPGVLPNVVCTLIAETAGVVQAPAGTLTVIETPIAGWNSFTNPLDAVLGTDIETDVAYRLRRAEALAAAGSATLHAIRTRLLEIDEVDAVVVFHNITMVVDAFGRPPKSIEAVVLGGKDIDIAKALWLVAPAGIELFGGVTVVIVDSQGFNQTIKFSRPTEIKIWLEVDLTVDPNYPVGGDQAVEDAILDYVRKTFSIGDDVITTLLYCPINTVAGIVGIVIRIGIAPNPLGNANIPISPDEIEVFDSARITVTS